MPYFYCCYCWLRGHTLTYSQLSAWRSLPVVLRGLHCTRNETWESCMYSNPLNNLAGPYFSYKIPIQDCSRWELIWWSFSNGKWQAPPTCDQSCRASFLTKDWFGVSSKSFGVQKDLCLTVGGGGILFDASKNFKHSALVKGLFYNYVHFYVICVIKDNWPFPNIKKKRVIPKPLMSPRSEFQFGLIEVFWFHLCF